MPTKAHEEASEPKATSNIVALPFIELETVLKALRMLRKMPDQSVLDNFNRRQSD